MVHNAAMSILLQTTHDMAEVWPVSSVVLDYLITLQCTSVHKRQGKLLAHRITKKKKKDI